MKHYLPLLSFLLTTVHATTVHVSPGGHDSNPGDAAAPVATLVQARDLIRAARGASPDTDATIVMHHGQYHLEETVVFDLRDSTSGSAGLRIEAAPGARPVLRGDRVITGWRKPATPPAGLPSAAADHVWVADLPRLPDGSKWCPRALYEHGVYRPISRTEPFQPSTPAASNPDTGSHPRTHWLHYPASATVRDWPNPEDIELVTGTNRNWMINFLPVASIDTANRRIRTGIFSTYLIQGNGSVSENTWIENTADGLDTPGEWFFNSQEEKIYFWPTTGAPGAHITAPVITELIRVEGVNSTFDFTYSADGNHRWLDHEPTPAELSQDQPVRNITFSGITFTGGDRERWNDFDRRSIHEGNTDPQTNPFLAGEVNDPDFSGSDSGAPAWNRAFQHGGEQYDHPNALLRFRGAHGCHVINCTFTHSASCGFRADHYAQQCSVTDSTFAYLGGNGILFAGYGPGPLDVNKHNIITRNHLHHTAQVVWCYNAIMLWQSGENEVTRNKIHDTAYDGIFLGGVRAAHYGGRHHFSGSNPNVLGQWKGNPRIHERLALLTKEQMNGVNYFGEMMPWLHTRNNLVGHNEIYNTLTRLDDGNAVYVSCTGLDNRIFHNLINNTRAPKSDDIRFDASQYFTIVENNIVVGSGVKAKQYNTIRNNYFFGGALQVNQKTENHAAGTVGHNLQYHIPSVADLYGTNTNTHPYTTYLKRTRTDYNIIYGSDPAAAKTFHDASQAEGTDQSSVFANPGFTGLETGSIEVEDTSLLTNLGITPLSLDGIGLPQDPPHGRFGRNISRILSGSPEQPTHSAIIHLDPVHNAIHWRTEFGVPYQLQSSETLSGWQNRGPVITGDGSIHYATMDSFTPHAGKPRLFFRLTPGS